ncbi:threonine ammonia-lyase [Kribbella deserti]|uniref:Threonine/serine dehydratase n=1 Tax=Kribbella deserti TaxID=1926257 RepID=A0ABV6QJR1_9ACTN
MTGDVIALESVYAAAERVAGRLHRTPMVEAETLNERFGGRFTLKAELFQKTGSYKVRGILNKVLTLTADERARGVITLSAGNAAGSLAWAARAAGIPATVVMPAGAVPAKVEAARAYGAEVVLAEGDLLAAYEGLRDERDLTAVHPFDDPEVIAGAGTVGLELVADRPDLDTVLVPIGGGGLISGVSLVIKRLLPSARVIGIEPIGADVVSRSLASGIPEKLPTARSVADGLAAPMCGVHTLAHIQQYVDEVVRVSEESLVEATRLVMSRTKLALEPAAAAPFAALLEGAITLRPGALTACVISGGNLDVTTVLTS